MIHLPLLEQVRQETADSLLEVQIAVVIKLPHFGAHLQEHVETARQTAVHDLKYCKNKIYIMQKNVNQLNIINQLNINRWRF